MHGIRKQHTADAPKFPDYHGFLDRLLDDELCIYHGLNEFDPVCIRKACDRYSLPDVTQSTTWLSTLDISREKWPDAPSHKLEDLCKQIGYKYVPHNALEDAMACANVFCALTGITIDSTIPATEATSDRPRTFRAVPSQKPLKGLKGNENGQFFETFIVISGEFASPWEDRNEFKLHLCTLGFTPRDSISGKTKILVIGEGFGPKKYKKASDMGITIMSESEFLGYINSEQ